jgi:hypothetical protein
MDPALERLAKKYLGHRQSDDTMLIRFTHPTKTIGINHDHNA